MENQSPANHKGFKTKGGLIRGILILVLVIASAYWFLKNDKQVANTSFAPTANVDTTGWQRHRDDKLGFEFMYPQNVLNIEEYNFQDSQIILQTPSEQENDVGVVDYYLTATTLPKMYN